MSRICVSALAVLVRICNPFSTDNGFEIHARHTVLVQICNPHQHGKIVVM